MYGADFEFVDIANPEKAAEYIKNRFCNNVVQMKREGKAFAADEVQILTPMRVKGKCGADTLNQDIQAALNPASPKKPEITVGSKLFRLFDKVMQTKNNGDISNGDIGRIREIVRTGNGSYEVHLDFGGGRTAIYQTNI